MLTPTRHGLASPSSLTIFSQPSYLLKPFPITFPYPLTPILSIPPVLPPPNA